MFKIKLHFRKGKYSPTSAFYYLPIISENKLWFFFSLFVICLFNYLFSSKQTHRETWLLLKQTFQTQMLECLYSGVMNVCKTPQCCCTVISALMECLLYNQLITFFRVMFPALFTKSITNFIIAIYFGRVANWLAVSLKQRTRQTNIWFKICSRASEICCGDWIIFALPFPPISFPQMSLYPASHTSIIRSCCSSSVFCSIHYTSPPISFLLQYF